MTFGSGLQLSISSIASRNLPVPEHIDHFGNVDFDRATALRVLLAVDHDAEFARAVVALLVAQHLEPHEHFHFALGVAERHVAEIAGVHELEVVGALLRRADVGRDVGIRRPTLRKALEHRIAAGEMIVDRLDELALELERHRPDEAHQDHAHIVVAQEQFPKHLGKARAEFLLLELPGDRTDAISHEGAAQRPGVAEQPLLEQRELLLEQLDGFGLLQLRECAARRLQRAGGLGVAQQVLIRRRAHRMISASQLAATRAKRAFSSGVIFSLSRTPGMVWATSFGAPSTTILVSSNISLTCW